MGGQEYGSALPLAEEALAGHRSTLGNEHADTLVSINQLAELCIALSGKSLEITNVPGPVGVAGRCSDNRLIAERLGWSPSGQLLDGLRITYGWIADQVAQRSLAEVG